MNIGLSILATQTAIRNAQSVVNSRYHCSGDDYDIPPLLRKVNYSVKTDDSKELKLGPIPMVKSYW